MATLKCLLAVLCNAGLCIAPVLICVCAMGVFSEHQSSGTNGMNPFAGFFTGADDKEEGGVVDDASQGRAVRALYNYEQAEDDEIGFQAGTVIC